MKKQIFNAIIIIISFIVIFLLPTSKLLEILLLNLVSIKNENLVFLEKVIVFLIVIYFLELDLKSSFESGKLYEFRTEKFRRNPIKYIIIIGILLEIMLTLVIYLLDLLNKINISGDGWLNYVGVFIGSNLTAIGLLLTLQQYLQQQEEKESPKIIVKEFKPENFVRRDAKYGYCKFNSKHDGGGRTKFEILISNIGSKQINNLLIRDNTNQYNDIFIKETDNSFFRTLSENENLILEIDAWFPEGMLVERVIYFELIYDDEKILNNYLMECKVTVNKNTGNVINVEKKRQIKIYNREYSKGL